MQSIAADAHKGPTSTTLGFSSCFFLSVISACFLKIYRPTNVTQFPFKTRMKDISRKSDQKSQRHFQSSPLLNPS